MKRCSTCNKIYDTSIIKCPNCGFEPSIIDGFKCYAPGFAHQGTGFKSSYFQDLARMEDANFWFRARNRLIIWALKKYCSNFHNFLEIGCGTGYVLSGVSKANPDVSVYGSEIFVAGLEYASERLPGADFMQMDAREIPYVDEFDVIGAFDVLEHIEEDRQVLAQIFSALRSNGKLLITVPQHQWLWSSTDEYACHVRRYSAKELHEKIKEAGFEVLRSTSFVSTLLPAMLVSRLLRKQNLEEGLDPTNELKISPWLNSLFEKILGIEIALIGKRINFPVGGSRLVVARKI